MNKQEPTTVYVPQPGEVVLIEWTAPGISDAVGDVVCVEHAELHPNGGCIMLTGIGTRAEERRCRYRDAFCRVRPASAIDVECPHVTDWQRFGLHPCGGTVGNPCSTMALARPMDIGCSHGARRDLFLSLTGQAPKDSDTKKREPLIVYAAACVNCSGDKRREVQSYAAMHLTFNTGLCGDCAAVTNGYGDRQARVQKLRSELNRPLPPKPAALRTWPADSGEEYEL